MFVDNQIDYGFLVAFEFFEQLTPQTIHKEVYDYPNNQKVRITIPVAMKSGLWTFDIVGLGLIGLGIIT